jgi:hypothetical protein
VACDRCKDRGFPDILPFVIPAKAGIQENLCPKRDRMGKATTSTREGSRVFSCLVVSICHLFWIPAFAGMTKKRVAGMTKKRVAGMTKKRVAGMTNRDRMRDDQTLMQECAFPMTYDLLPITRSSKGVCHVR